MFRDRERHRRTPAHEVALDCLGAGVRAAHPSAVIQEAVTYDSAAETVVIDDRTHQLDRVEDIYVVGGGNAAGAAAAALEAVFGDRLTDGSVVTDVPAETGIIDVLQGDHPVPSRRGVENTTQMLGLARDATAEDLVIALIGGGGSALLIQPADGISLDTLQQLTDALLRSGATIDEINTVRKHLSEIKGGQLARLAAPADVIGLVFSDVVGNDPSVVASGPTAPDESTAEDALRVLDRYDIPADETVRRHLAATGTDGPPETPGEDARVFEDVKNHVVVDAGRALRSAGDEARSHGYTPLVLSARMRGESREIAKAHVAIAEECLHANQPVEPPAVLLSGGETTVTVTGDGTGGPNQEFTLSAAIEGAEAVVVGALDTDGVDGATEAAGALVGPEAGIDTERAEDALETNDSHPLLDECNATLYTGETGTNVNDLRVLVVG